VEDYKEIATDSDAKVLEQSKKLQVESQVNNESGITQSKMKTLSAGKGKSFTNKRKRKKKRKQQQQKNEDIRSAQNENLTRYEDEERDNNYEIVITTATPKASRRNCEYFVYG
jgi:hypothetical protein